MTETLDAALAGVSCFLAGLSWVVHVVVYPSFRIVGPTPQWRAFHDAHSRRITAVVGPPWVAQAACLAVLLLERHRLELVVPVAALAAAAVVLTVLGAVPAHTRLSTYDDEAVSRLMRASAWRTAAWTLCALLTLVLAA